MVGRCVFPRQFPRSPDRASTLPPSEMAAWRAVARVLRSPVDAVSCAVFPSQCRLCNQPLLHLSTAPICAVCWADLPEQIPDSLCTLCGERLSVGGLRFATTSAARTSDTGNLCHLCERATPPFQLAVAVPLHATKQRERGFNQTALLAEATVRSLRRQRPDLELNLAFEAMGRQRATENQSGLTPHQRRRNLRGAFFIRQLEKVAGRAILLLDDIYTTGATARECTRTLLGSGALSVHVATLARSQREGVAFWDGVGAGSMTTAESLQRLAGPVRA